MKIVSKNPVVHFEMPYKDAKRVSEFYAKVFGWEMAQMGEQMGNYITAATTDLVDGKNQTPATIGGGFFPHDASLAGRAVPSVVIQVENIEKAIADVKAAGGTIDGEPMDIPGVGRWVAFVDTEGNRASLMQSK